MFWWIVLLGNVVQSKINIYSGLRVSAETVLVIFLTDDSWLDSNYTCGPVKKQEWMINFQLLLIWTLEEKKVGLSYRGQCWISRFLLIIKEVFWFYHVFAVIGHFWTTNLKCQSFHKDLKLKNLNQYFAKLEKFILSCLGQIYFCLSKVTCVAH